MNKKEQQLYTSPEVEVIESQVQTVLCQSNEEIDRDNQDW